MELERVRLEKDLENVRAKYDKEMVGKCFDCKYRKRRNFCEVRETVVNVDFLGINFILFDDCKYYEKK